MTTEHFHLAAPPGFRGLDSHKPLKVYYRHLPHWRQDGATYFVTFRLADALPQDKLRFLKRLRAEWQREREMAASKRKTGKSARPTGKSALPTGSGACPTNATSAHTMDDNNPSLQWEQYAREVTRRVLAWTDEGLGASWFSQSRWAVALRDCLQRFEGERYSLGCWVIMPNHCHLAIRPFEGFALQEMLGQFKGITARKINSAIGVSGSLWQDESYDKIIRDEEHLWNVVQYIGRNPAACNLPEERWYRWINPQWRAAGWDFVDKMHCNAPKHGAQQ